MHTRVYHIDDQETPEWTGDAPALRENDLLSTPRRAAVRVVYVKTHLLDDMLIAQEVKVR